jgi:hypothetical protein
MQEANFIWVPVSAVLVRDPHGVHSDRERVDRALVRHLVHGRRDEVAGVDTRALEQVAQRCQDTLRGPGSHAVADVVGDIERIGAAEHRGQLLLHVRVGHTLDHDLVLAGVELADAFLKRSTLRPTPQVGEGDGGFATR